MGKTGEASILSAIEKLEGDTVKVRGQGLDDLRRILGQGRGSSRVDALSDDVFHKILEVLFRIVRAEKQSYLRAANSKTKSGAVSRLTHAAAALRLVVEVATPKLKHKTAAAVLDHIADTLPAGEAGYCNPLEPDYLKIFWAILDYSPHAEHLRPKQWQRYVDFVTGSLSSNIDDEDNDGGSGQLRQTSMTSRNSLNISIRGSQTSNNHGSQPSSESNVESQLKALRCLTGTTNAPLISRLSEILNVVIAWIKTKDRGRDIAFECLNHLLPLALNEDLDLVVGIFHDIGSLISQQWTNKHSTLNDQMLVTLFYLRHLYLNTLWGPEMIHSDLLDALISTIWTESEKRSEREILQLTDLNLTDVENAPPLSLKNVSPAFDAIRVDIVATAWASLSILAYLIIGLDKKRRSVDQAESYDGGGKRRRLENSVEDVFQRAINSTGQTRYVALQLSLFVIDRMDDVDESLLEYIARLQAFMSDEDPVTCSWTFIVLARCTHLPRVAGAELASFWQHAWTAASRALNNSACCRSACHLMRNLMQSAFTKSFLGAQTINDSFWSDGRNGPGSFSDAAILALSQALRSGLLDNDKIFKHFASRSLSWLDSQWLIPPVPDREHTFLMATFGQPSTLYVFLALTMGNDAPVGKPIAPVFTGGIYHAAYIDTKDLDLTKFTLSDNFGGTAVKHNQATDLTPSDQLPRQAYLSDQAILDFLLSKTRAFISAWDALAHERASGVNADVAEVAATLCILVSQIAGEIEDDDQTQAVASASTKLWQRICELCSHRRGDSFEGLIAKLSDRLLQIRSTDSATEHQISNNKQEISKALLATIDQTSETQDIATLEVDFLDSFDTRTSQSSLSRPTTTNSEVMRQDLPYPHDVRSSFLQSTLLLRLETVSAANAGFLDTEVMAEFVEHVSSLEHDELFQCRSVIMQVLSKDINIKRADTCRLIEKFGEVCLRDDNLERCEAALCVCLRLLTNLSHVWTTDGYEDDELNGCVFDVYDWYLKIAIGKGIASPRVLLSIGSLLGAILKSNASYGSGELPSARTTLLQVLSIGSSGIKFCIAPQLSQLFDGYVLSEHTAIFQDIVENLPSDADNKEGIQVRLYILAYLGARWHTILRQAIYHIFETTANVPGTTNFAKKCLQMMCSYLKLDGPRSLLHLFAPQILYTWLEKQSIDAIPFNAFDYQSLSDLINDLRDEFVAQSVMRGSSEHAQKIIHNLGSSWDGLIEQCFSRAVAYAMISDISLHRSSREIGKAETSLLELLGESKYAALLHNHFPEALAIIMLRLTDDRGFEKAFGNEDEANEFIAPFDKMHHYSSSKTELPPGQQPSFRAKYLVHILNRLSSHAQVSLEQLWSSPMLISIYRSLLDDINPAFGPLHACATLRKIRMVICLAGHKSLSGFPLKMLLHNLRPLLTTFHCSQDAIGIFWYLLENSKEQLASSLSFMAGLGVSIFTALSSFVSSSQDSTTQESHFTSTISKAHEFHKWLGDFLVDFDTSELSDDAAKSFRNIAIAAREVKTAGTNDSNTSEGSLLFHLIMDQASQDPLLSKMSFQHSLQILCHGFVFSADQSDDILSDQECLVSAVPILWDMVQNVRIQDQLRIWTGHTLGRACALLGPEHLNSLLRRNSHHDANNKASIEMHDSHSVIITTLTEQIWGNERSAASISEQTLQTIFSNIPRVEKKAIIGSDIPEELFLELRFDDFESPRLPQSSAVIEISIAKHRDVTFEVWAARLGVELCRRNPGHPVLSHLAPVFHTIPNVASRILPSIVHLSLTGESNLQNKTREDLSSLFSEILEDQDPAFNANASLVLSIITYLRRCSMSTETTMSQRDSWLVINFQAASDAACRCGMYHHALLMLEISASQQASVSGRSTSRSSYGNLAVPKDSLAKLYRHIDDPDSFYGTIQGTDVASLVTKLSHEGAGQKALSFQSALLDSTMRLHGLEAAAHASGSATISALSLASFHGLANIVQQSADVQSSVVVASVPLQSSLNLQQWDTGPSNATGAASKVVSGAFRILSSTANLTSTLHATDEAILKLTHGLANFVGHRSDLLQKSVSLAVVAELREILGSKTYDDLSSFLSKSYEVNWFRNTGFDNIEQILLGREAMFATIKDSIQLQKSLSLSTNQASLLEIKALRASLAVGHRHDMDQFCLNRAAYMSALIPSTADRGLRIDAAVQYDLANTLWAQSETSASIEILHQLRAQSNFKDQAIAVSHAEILTDLGQKLTQARLERPDEVTAQYLQPAISSLGKETSGSKAGRVYHNFAAFCDQQLSDSDNLDEFDRIGRLRNKKKQEVADLEALKATKEGRERDQIRPHLNRAKIWFQLDDQEWRRLRKYRDGLVSDCLEHYLRAMRACGDYPNDVLRFLALWLEQSQNEDANSTVAKYLPSVPSHMFAPLMNQLSSRILSTDDHFQKLLFSLMFRICNEHPYHSLYQVFATSKSTGQKNDTAANSRHQAAKKLAETVRMKGSATTTWICIHNSNIAFVRVAQERAPDRDFKAGSKLQLRKLSSGTKLEKTIEDLHQGIPPPTMNIPLRPDGNYASIPNLAKFDQGVTIAGGVSAPKIVTAIATDGSRHKMLLKGGNDDLRQDSIMEQVFEQVSNLLKDHRATRQRRLGIRTYKVIPLTHNAGIIEFVKDTMPLHDYVLPAHARHFPKDYKASRCRKEIAEAQTKPLSHRLQVYRTVTANFHPVMRFFFMEKFLDPDDWFQKRLNYSRSTAAISMLGHVLGLGDRHGHNILLDTNTGEVVHIDLGVAFEAGRVLPVPEVVPFRLTRDLVDAMGISGVEGVFRRCCVFTLEALRQDQEAIMTILDVLRWDPLYSWSVSPLRLQRMQENQEQAAASTDPSNNSNDNQSENHGTSIKQNGNGAAAKSVTADRQPDLNEPSEADRALAVVAKKLGKTLSVEATVNDLIRQATDERNLAVLYCGWAAYA